MMNKILFLFGFLFSLLCVSCNSKPNVNVEVTQFEITASIQAVKPTYEDFHIFIDQFQSDSVFQKERIVFPLKNLLYNTDSGLFDEKVIEMNEWEFMDFQTLPKNYLKSITQLNVEEFTYNIQIVDTGVSVNYIFKIHEEKWYLIEIRDEST